MCHLLLAKTLGFIREKLCRACVLSVHLACTAPATYWRSLYPKAWLYGSPTASVELHDLLTSRNEMIGRIGTTRLVQSAIAARQWFFLAKGQIIRTPDFI
jgi:hypothetical protein